MRLSLNPRRAPSATAPQMTQPHKCNHVMQSISTEPLEPYMHWHACVISPPPWIPAQLEGQRGMSRMAGLERSTASDTRVLALALSMPPMTQPTATPNISHLPFGCKDWKHLNFKRYLGFGVQKHVGFATQLGRTLDRLTPSPRRRQLGSTSPSSSVPCPLKLLAGVQRERPRKGICGADAPDERAEAY